ncbi:VOC family protein [Microlunatus flavus]|uniref:Uncharacterized conserved protein PhnB, glyoxalase superfamily n=1 Tax=Microlunatus flavus TaxID=1036181 RepID=A0A1H9ASR7_9ACTN|nr:VOC family protein [Microlunatus flavus]SEP79699.1 Uncharacterized conserved protein PhnB, glyoxalase superfamily [Microlunatus flavus]
MTDPAPQTPSRPPSVWPAFRASDAPALIDFLVDVVGFRRTAVYPDGDAAAGRVAHAQLDWPEGGAIMLGSDRDDDGPRPGTAGLYVVTDHVDAVHARVSAAPGVRITREPDDPGYGGREFSMTDPEGNHWSFGSYRGEPAPRA